MNKYETNFRLQTIIDQYGYSQSYDDDSYKEDTLKIRDLFILQKSDSILYQS